MKWSLRLSLTGPYGERIEYALPLAEDISADIARIDPPSVMAPFERTFDSTVCILKRKEFRKSLFRNEAARLGSLLAERMEDAEGWHDVERIESAKKQLGLDQVIDGRY